MANSRTDPELVLQTQLITLTLPIQPTPLKMRWQLEAAIAHHGTALRWAITRVDRDRHTVQVEAVVITPSA